MRCYPTAIEGCFVLEPQVFEDDRGYFLEVFNQREFARVTGLSVNFVQDNESYSKQGVIRGLHYQKGDAAQAKLVRVIRGMVLDVAVDIRPESSTFGQYVAEELSSENHRQLFVPRGFAHGFAVLSNDAIVNYKCDNFYDKSAESGVVYKDETLNINWKIPDNKVIIRDRDLDFPSLSEIL